MARPRSELSDILRGFCGENVYFQPPTGYKLTYPCIVYNLETFDVRRADNAGYTLYDKYEITYITRDPDTDIQYRIADLPMCSPGHFFVNDNLYHYPFTIYF